MASNTLSWGDETPEYEQTLLDATIRAEEEAEEQQLMEAAAQASQEVREEHILTRAAEEVEAAEAQRLQLRLEADENIDGEETADYPELEIVDDNNNNANSIAA